MLAVVAALALLLYACSGSGSGKKQPVADGQSTGPAASQSSVPTGGSSSAAAGGTSGASSAGAPSGGVSGSSSAGGAGGTGTTGPGSAPTGTANGPGCQLSLSLTTGAPAYANGDNPQFTVALVNKGTADCDVDVSPKSLVLNVYSGQERIWSSADCATGGKDLRGIGPGAVQTVTLSWNRTRSAPGCPANGAAAKLGMYFGVVSLGSGGSNAPVAQSQPKNFELKTGS